MYHKILVDYLKISYFFGTLLLIFSFIRTTGLRGDLAVSSNFAYLLSFLILIIYYSTLIYFTSRKIILQKKQLITLLLVFSLVFVTMTKFSFFLHNGTLFEYTYADSYYYDLYTREIVSGDLVTGIEYLFSQLDYPDWGFFLYTSFVYSIYPSEMLLGLANIISSLFAASFLFEIVRRFLPKDLSGTAILMVFMSSYFLFYQASGLKEIFFVTLVLGFFYRAQIFYEKPDLFNFFIMFLFATPIAFLRPPVLVFAIIAIAVLYFRSILKSPIYAVFLLMILILVGIGFSEIGRQYSHYFRGIEDVTIKQQSTVSLGGGVMGTFLVSALSGLMGPFPTFSFVGKENVFLFSSGLILRVFLSYFFFIGVYNVFKKKVFQLLPMIVFTLLEIFSLSLIMESFELRLNMPHFPFVIIISIFGIYSRFQEVKSSKNRFFELTIFIISLAIVFMWNMR